jgi:hypothetical protein
VKRIISPIFEFATSINVEVIRITLDDPAERGEAAGI